MGNAPCTFAIETRDSGRLKVVLQEELDEVFGNVPDLDEEEEEWQEYGAKNSEGGFATGVTFNELATVGTLLGKGHLAPNGEQQAVDIVRRTQETELFDLLENSIESASSKIAKLLDGSIQQPTSVLQQCEITVQMVSTLGSLRKQAPFLNANILQFLKPKSHETKTLSSCGHCCHYYHFYFHHSLKSPTCNRLCYYLEARANHGQTKH